MEAEQKMREALQLIRDAVVGDKNPRWSDERATSLTRWRIADICDMALGNVQYNAIG